MRNPCNQGKTPEQIEFSERACFWSGVFMVILFALLAVAAVVG